MWYAACSMPSASTVVGMVRGRRFGAEDGILGDDVKYSATLQP
jgi:hypothetical protein